MRPHVDCVIIAMLDHNYSHQCNIVEFKWANSVELSGHSLPPRKLFVCLWWRLKKSISADASACHEGTRFPWSQEGDSGNRSSKATFQIIASRSKRQSIHGGERVPGEFCASRQIQVSLLVSRKDSTPVSITISLNGSQLFFHVRSLL